MHTVLIVSHTICCFYIECAICVCVKTQNEKELSSEMLSHVARSLTLWEFMMLKLGRGRANAEQAKVAEILTEFSELHNKVKAVSHSVLMPAIASLDAEESDTSKHVMVRYSYTE